MSAHSFRTRGTLVAAGVAAIGIFAWSGHDGRVEAIKRANPAVVTATLKDQTDLFVTVYNSNIALVRDVRQLALPSGTLDLQLADIAASVNPATVHFRSLSEPSKLGMLEQNYEYDLLGPERLLKKYVGRDVMLVRTRSEAGTSKQEIVTARLLAYNDAPVWQIGNEIVTGYAAEQYRFPEIPGNLHSRPTLVWKLENNGAREHRIETSYLAGNLSWSADYVLTVGGELNRVDGNMKDEFVMAKAAQRAASPEAFAREVFSEYHLYSLNRRTTLEENETKQISLLNGSGTPVKKLFVVNGQNFYYRNRQNPGSPLKDSVQVFYKFRNDEASGLGMPMPAGVIRVYQADTKGGLQFAGEDRIDHTPKDEDVTIKIGTAFDVICERKQTDFVRIADNVYEMAFEIRLRNHKATPITVQVNEPIAGDWRMLSSTYPAKKTEAWAAQFDVPVAAGAESVLQYRVRVR